MPSEYTTPVLDFVALAADQFPHQTHQYRDQQQQQHQQQHQSSPSTISMSVPMSMPIPASPLLPLSSGLGSTAAPTTTTTTTQQTQAKMCATCNCALIPESLEIVDVQGVRNVVCTTCIAGEMMLHQYNRRQQQQHHQHQQQQHQQQHQMEELQLPSSHSLASAPMVSRGPSPPQFPSVIVIPPSISPVQNVTPSSPVTQPTQHATMVESQHVTLSPHSPVLQTIGSIPVHRSPPMPIGENILGEEGKDDDEHVDMRSQEDNGRKTRPTSITESESCGENVTMLDEQEVQDSSSLASISVSGSDPNSSSGSASASMNEGVDQEVARSPLSQSGSFHSPSVPPQPLPQQPSSDPALLPPSQIPVKAETIEPLAQTAHDPSPPPSSSPFVMSPSHPTNSLVALSSTSQPSSRRMKLLEPDPLTDISRLRVRSHTQDCLYPGAQFRGTQKSGRSSYDVSVTIVDVDFQSSFLCGYLHIRNLTEDWPELTTYFDAQIIGSRYGFLTQDWGATETEDVTHWSRFPAYERVKPLISGPKMNIPDDASLSSIGGKVESSSSKGPASAPRSSAPVHGPGNGGCVFMRWKERFLVPDHRVRDINGASFAGFYYVCVEFNPARSNASLKRRRKKVERKSSSNHATRDTNVNIVREGQGEEQQIRDQIIFPSSLSSNTNTKPPDTDVEMDEIEDPNNVRRERRFVGMEMEMDMGGDMDGLRDVLTPSRSRSLIRGTNTANPSHSRSHTRRRRRREEQQYERYREDTFGNTTSAAVTSRRDILQHSYSLPLPITSNPDDNCDDTSLSYREWERVTGRDREREREREYNHERRRGRMTERQSRSETQDDQNSFLFPRSAVQSQVHTHTRTVVEPESEDSGSEYEYEYEYDENVYSDDPAYDDTLGSTPGGPYTATMSGYYFHQHSEPYQQLSLRHVPRQSTGSFEFR